MRVTCSGNQKGGEEGGGGGAFGGGTIRTVREGAA